MRKILARERRRKMISSSSPSDSRDDSTKVDSYLKTNFQIEEEDGALMSILKTTSSISKFGDVVTFREEGKEEFSFHTDTNREYRDLLKNLGTRSERLLGTIINSISPSISKEDELGDRVRLATHKCLDTIATFIMKNKKNKRNVKTSSIADDHVQNQNRLQDKFSVEKPQLKFEKIDNGRDTIFKPKIRTKPNSVVKLCLRKIQNDRSNGTLQEHLQSLGVPSASPRTSSKFYYAHPYEVEINSYVTPAAQLLRVSDLIRPKHVNTEAIYVDTEQKLDEMNQNILKSSCVAVDLEHHSYRSFQGFTCLMQCTTSDNTDYIVDTIALRSKMHSCNAWTTNPEILKVLHGADRDVLWLQRDFGVYIVNMFDTGQASRVLNFPSFALSHLLLKYCDVKAQKQYQLSDWRQRPLSNALRKYAQEDTHYLLYIAMTLRNELIDSSTSKIESVPNLLHETLRRSKEITLKRYEIPTFDPDAYSKVMLRTCSRLAPNAERVFAALFEWRDRIARELDESTGYVLSSAAMAQLAEHMPVNVADVVSCLHPVPPIVRRRAVEIARVVETAKQRKRRPSELISSTSLENVDEDDKNNDVKIPSAESGTSKEVAVEGDDESVLRRIASKCNMRTVSWSFEKTDMINDLIETTTHDKMGDIYVKSTSKTSSSVLSQEIHRELTETIRSSASRLWKALTTVEGDLMKENEEEEEEEEEPMKKIEQDQDNEEEKFKISPAQALAQSILQERGEIKVDDDDDIVNEGEKDMQLPKSILETYGEHAVRSGRRKRRNKTNTSKSSSSKKKKKKNPPPSEKKTFQPYNYDDLASKYNASAASTLLLSGARKRKRQSKKKNDKQTTQQQKKPQKKNAAALLKPRKRMMTFSHQKKK